jgi:hypothetical protein
MLTARELQELLESKGRLDAWMGQMCESGPFYGADDPRYEELEKLLWHEDFVNKPLEMLVVLRSEYIEQLLAQQGSDPLVQKLRLVDSIVSSPRHI